MGGEALTHDSGSSTVQLKQEKSVEEAIKRGMDRAYENDTSAQPHEDFVSQLTPSDRGCFQPTELIKQAYKMQMLRLKTKSAEDNCHRWNRDFLELTDSKS